MCEQNCSRRVKWFEWQISDGPARRRGIASQIIQSCQKHADGDRIFLAGREIKTRVVLVSSILSRQRELYLLNVRDPSKTAADRISKAYILSRGPGGRTNVHST